MTVAFTARPAAVPATVKVPGRAYLSDLLAHMQEWTVKDLKSRGINVKG